MALHRARKAQEKATWDAFSKFVRTRDAIRTTGTLSEVECFTCGLHLPTAASQAGHIISRAYRGALYNPNVVFAQCPRCNLWFEGNHVLGFLNLVKMIGWEKAVMIVEDSMKPMAYDIFQLEDIEEGCEAAREVLEEEYEQWAK